MTGYVLDSGYGFVWWGLGLGSITIPINPERRLKGHHRRVWWRDVAHHSLEWLPSEREALAAEDLTIRDKHPLHNRIRTNPTASTP